MKFNLGSQELINCLNGFLCVYKHRDISLPSLKKRIMRSITATINSLDPMPIPTIERPIVETHGETGAPLVVGMRKQLDYTLHPLVYGMTIREEDILLDEVEPMDPTTSGVCLFAVNDGCEKLEAVRDSSWVNQYIINGILGEESDKNLLRSKVILKARYGHVSRNIFEKLLTRICHQYRRLSYELSNVDIQSEEAFEIAQSGAIRPRVLGSPLIYDVQTMIFDPPRFQLKIVCTGEDDQFLRSFINELGCSLNTVARPTRLQRIQFGPFLRSHALLDKHFQLPTIIKNIQMCNAIVDSQLVTDNNRFLKTMDKEQSLSYLKEYFLDHEHIQQAFDSAVEQGLETGDCIRMPWGRDYE